MKKISLNYYDNDGKGCEYDIYENGEVTMVDPDNGEPIPHTAGMIQICRESNYDTYGNIQFIP